MKKILCIALFSLFTFAASAQLGAKAGVNFSTWHGDNIDDNSVDGLFGVYLGFYYNWSCGDHFAVEPQLFYSTEGTKADDGDTKLRADYLNLTVLAKWTMHRGTGLFLGAGPELGFLLSASEKDPNVASFDVKDDMGSVNFAIALAAGYDWNCGFGVYGRFNLGLSNLADDQGNFASLGEVKQNTWQFGLRYAFNHNGMKNKK